MNVCVLKAMKKYLKLMILNIKTYFLFLNTVSKLLFSFTTYKKMHLKCVYLIVWSKLKIETHLIIHFYNTYIRLKKFKINIL